MRIRSPKPLIPGLNRIGWRTPAAVALATGIIGGATLAVTDEPTHLNQASVGYQAPAGTQAPRAPRAPHHPCGDYNRYIDISKVGQQGDPAEQDIYDNETTLDQQATFMVQGTHQWTFHVDVTADAELKVLIFKVASLHVSAGLQYQWTEQKSWQVPSRVPRRSEVVMSYGAAIWTGVAHVYQLSAMCKPINDQWIHWSGPSGKYVSWKQVPPGTVHGASTFAPSGGTSGGPSHGLRHYHRWLHPRFP